MASSYGASQIAPYEGENRALYGYQLEIDAKLLLGRRSNYGEEENKLRNRIYAETNHEIDIISYDRVLEAIDKILRPRTSRHPD
jgi:hypothetical protein